jgi:hypothetical protein
MVVRSVAAQPSPEECRRVSATLGALDAVVADVAKNAAETVAQKLMGALPGIVRAELQRLQRKPQPLTEILTDRSGKPISPAAARKREERDPGLKKLVAGHHGRRRLYFADEVHAYYATTVKP